jgi:bifunctional N-acetylglucosamine-1-phosphate-uridyltransferase/glucosamine-1-phosphate-acetyltransferase GlmU-like protein
MPTHHQKIMIAKDQAICYEDVLNHIIEIAAAAQHENDVFVVGKIKQLVPEYISKNSVFELLDQKVNL